MIHLLDKQTDQIIATLRAELVEANHEESLDDLVELLDFESVINKKAPYIAKRNRVVIPGEDGIYREFILDRVEKTGGRVYGQASASYLDLEKQKIIDPLSLDAQTLESIASNLLLGTEWKVGIVEWAGTRKVVFDDPMGAYTALKRLCTLYGMEMRFRIVVEGNVITGRYVDFYKRRGQFHGKEATFGKDLLEIRRIEEGEIVTALKCYGPEREDGTRLVIDVVDDDALQRWGRGGKHLWGTYEPETEDQEMTEARLRTLGRTELNKRINSIVQYETTQAALDTVQGMAHEKVVIADTVRIKDTHYQPPLYMEARVRRVKRSLLDESKKEYTLGDFIEYREEDVRARFKELQKLWKDRLAKLLIPSIVSSAGTVFKNGQGRTDLTAILVFNGQELDADGTIHRYEWAKYDKDGRIVPGWSRTGKTITVTAAEISEKAIFIVHVLSDKVDVIAQETVTSVYDGTAGDQGPQGPKGDKGDAGVPGVQGPPGQDGQSLYTWVKYARDSKGTGLSDDPTDRPYIGFAYNKTTPVQSSDPTAYTWARIEGDQGVKGADGETYYTWLKYADTAAGAGMSDSPAGKLYMGLAYNKKTAAESTNPADYTWSLIKGDKGDKGDTGPKGEPGSNAPLIKFDGTGQIFKVAAGGAVTPATLMVTGLAVNTAITLWSYSINGGAFNTAAPAGVSRSGNTVTINGASMTATTIAVRASDGTVSDTFTIAKVQDGAAGAPGATGPKGDSGAAGAPGQDAYTVLLTNEAHTFPGSNSAAVAASVQTSVIAYKGTAQVTPSSITVGTMPTGMTASVSGSTVTFNVTTAMTSASGTVALTIVVDGRTFTRLFSYAISYKGATGAQGPVGPKGDQGVQGPKGADGQTLYTWVKYADTPTTGMSDSPSGKTYIGLAYNKTTPTESANYADYSWSLIKGEQGVQGPKGADGQTTYTWIRYADTETGTNMSASPAGKRFLGLAYNKTTATPSANPADYSWSPLYDNVRVGGRNLFEGGELSKYTGTGTNREHMYYADIWHVFEKLKVGDEITISFDVEMAIGGRLQVYNSNQAGEIVFAPTKVFEGIGTEKTRLSFTSKVVLNSGPIRTPGKTMIEFYSTYGTSDWFTVSNLKIEKGNVATDWTPAPEDVQVEIEKAKEDARNAHASANSKNTVYRQATEPSTVDKKDGDLWFDTANGNRISVFQNGVWAFLPLDHKALSIENLAAISADMGKITAGEFLWNLGYGGTLTLGGPSNGNGKLVVLNSDGEVIAELDAGAGGFTDLFVGQLDSPSVWNVNNDDLQIYVDPVNGDDENTGFTSYKNGKQTIRGAIESIPKINNGNVTITVDWGYAGSIYENIFIEGFAGKGSITVNLQRKENVLRGRVFISGTTNYVKINSGTLTAPLAGSSAFIVERAMAEATGISVWGSNVPNHGFMASKGGILTVTDCYIREVNYYAISATLGGIVYARDNGGLSGSAGLTAINGGIIMGGGKAPQGSNTNQYESGGKILNTFDFGTPPPPPVAPPTTTETTTAWTRTASESWQANSGGQWANSLNKMGTDVIQGKYNSAGPHSGLWFFGTGVRNAVVGKTIKQIRVRLKRKNSGGSSASVGAVIRPHGYATKPAGAPSFLNASHTVGFKWGESKWVTLPSSFHTFFSNGTAYGIGIYTTSTANSQYMRFEGLAEIEITYNK